MTCTTVQSPSEQGNPLAPLYQQLGNAPANVAKSIQDGERARLQADQMRLQNELLRQQIEQQRAKQAPIAQQSSDSAILADKAAARMKYCMDSTADREASQECVARAYLQDAEFARGLDLMLVSADPQAAAAVRANLETRLARLRQSVTSSEGVAVSKPLHDESAERVARTENFLRKMEACIRLEKSTGEKADVCRDKLIVSDPEFAKAFAEANHPESVAAWTEASGKALSQKPPN